METDVLQVRTPCREDSDHRSDQCFGKVAHCEYDVDMGGSGGTNKRMKGANSAVVDDNSRVEFSDLEARAH